MCVYWALVYDEVHVLGSSAQYPGGIDCQWRLMDFVLDCCRAMYVENATASRSNRPLPESSKTPELHYECVHAWGAERVNRLRTKPAIADMIARTQGQCRDWGDPEVEMLMWHSNIQFWCGVHTPKVKEGFMADAAYIFTNAAGGFHTRRSVQT